jgi:hypothetical protein
MGGSLSSSRRVFIQDARGGEGFLRATWHADGGTVVMSSWEGDVCVAATRVKVEDTAELIGMLARALAEAAVAASTPEPAPLARSWRERAELWLRRWRGRRNPVEAAGELHWMQDHRRVV